MPISSPLKVRSLLSAYAAKRLTPTEVVASALARIAEIDRPEVWILRVPAADLEARAHALEALYEAQGSAVFERMPLFGVPFAVKDNIDVAGLPTTAACEPFSYTPDTSAFAVQRLIDAGAILIGKTNLDQFATGLVGTRSPYGAVRNTEFPERVSGGSSSGSAVAVAAGCVAFSLGTDTAGSGRVPAGFNGLVGLKPSLGLVSKRGVVPACRSLDTISVFAHDVDDAWCVFNEIACFDPLDGYSRKVPGLGLLRGAPRIGVPDHLEFYGDAAANQAFSAALDTLSTHLHLAPTPIDFQPLKQVSALLYDGPWVAERRAALGAFFETHHEAVDPVVATVIGKADRYSAADAFNGQYALADLKRHAEQLFETIDILIVPTTPTHPLIADVQANPVELNSQLGYYTNFVNLLDLCALAVPCQRRHDGLPAGVTLIAPSGADRRLAELGARIQALFASEAADAAGTASRKENRGRGKHDRATAVSGADRRACRGRCASARPAAELATSGSRRAFCHGDANRRRLHALRACEHAAAETRPRARYRPARRTHRRGSLGNAAAQLRQIRRRRARTARHRHRATRQRPHGEGLHLRAVGGQ